MRRRKQKKYNLLLLILLGLTIGFALLSTTLKINGTANIKSNAWDIYWDSDSISVADKSISDTLPTVSNKTTVSYTADLELPGDFYEFTIDAVNNGTINGEITKVETKFYEEDGETLVTTPSTYIKNSVTYEDGTQVKEGDILAKKGTDPTRKKYKIRVEYDKKATTLPENDINYVIKTEITYTQTTKNPPVEGPVKIKASKVSAEVGEEVKITVTITDQAAWNLSLTGAITDSIVGYDEDGNNATTIKEYTLNTSTAGTYTIHLTGDVTDEEFIPTDIDKTITVTIS